MEREDVIIVATVSAIYGLGDPVSYREQMVTLTTGQKIDVAGEDLRCCGSCESGMVATTS